MPMPFPLPMFMHSDLTLNQVLEQYNLINSSIDALSSRRQTTNEVYVGINVLFLTAVGVLLYSAQFNSWWTVSFVITIACGVYPINRFWLRSLRTYEALMEQRYKNLQALTRTYEILSQTDIEESEDKSRDLNITNIYITNIWAKIEEGTLKVRASHDEVLLARYFQIIYILISVVVALITIIVTNHIISVR